MRIYRCDTSNTSRFNYLITINHYIHVGTDDLFGPYYGFVPINIKYINSIKSSVILIYEDDLHIKGDQYIAIKDQFLEYLESVKKIIINNKPEELL